MESFSFDDSKPILLVPTSRNQVFEASVWISVFSLLRMVRSVSSLKWWITRPIRSVCDWRSHRKTICIGTSRPTTRTASSWWTQTNASRGRLPSLCLNVSHSRKLTLLPEGAAQASKRKVLFYRSAEVKAGDKVGDETQKKISGTSALTSCDLSLICLVTWAENYPIDEIGMCCFTRSLATSLILRVEL